MIDFLSNRFSIHHTNIRFAKNLSELSLLTQADLFAKITEAILADGKSPFEVTVAQGVNAGSVISGGDSGL